MYDPNTAAARCLDTLLRKRGQMGRIAERSLLQACYKLKRPEYMWGGRLNYFKLSFYVALLTSLAVPCVTAFWFKSRGQPLPGGAFYLLLVLLVAIFWPVLATFIRSREIRRRKSISEEEFLIGISHEDGPIEKHAIITLRRAIAAAYCIPVELVGPDDGRKSMNAMSLMCPPLAIEIMADVCRLSNINFEIKSLRLVEHHFRDFRPISLAQLVHHIHSTMKAEGLLKMN